MEIADNSVTGGDIDESSLGSQLVRDLQLVSETSPVGSSPFVSHAADCPGNRKAMSGGGEIINAGGGDEPPEVAIQGSFPGPSAADRHEWERWVVFAAETSATTADWFLVAYAVCARI